MRKQFLKMALAALALLVPSLASAQQNVLVQTTLSAAVTAPTAGGLTSTIQVASATGITAGLNPTTTINSQNFYLLYVDREAMAVVAVNGTTLTVIRGYNSTRAVAHVSGQMVLYGKQQWFYTNDPGATSGNPGGVGGEGCTTASVLVSPWLNIRTGAQWLCSSITGTWVPGFNNSLVPADAAPTTAVASVAGSTLPSGPLFHVTGTNAITGWTIPVGCNATAVGSCYFTIIPDAVFSWTAAGNIAVASSALPGGLVVANHPVTFFWDAKNSKWLFIPGA